MGADCDSGDCTELVVDLLFVEIGIFDICLILEGEAGRFELLSNTVDFGASFLAVSLEEERLESSFSIESWRSEED